VATLGPASDAPETVRRLIEAGVGVFRLNFSHGDEAAHAARIATVRRVAKEVGQPVAILGDLQGPKIRVGSVAEGGVRLEAGQDVVFTTREGDGFDGAGTSVLPSGWDGLAAEVQPGERVLVNDGAVRLLAVERRAGDSAGVLRCRVMVGGVVTSRKGINLPDSDVKASAITERDWRHVEFCVAHGVDFVALSFVRSAEEVVRLKTALAGMCAADRTVDGLGGGSGALIPVIAKIEKPQAVRCIEKIVEAADGIMVARGDLGVEMDLADVPVVQKRLIRVCDEFGKPCIVATQMLESMITSATPTRAEVSDVANAVMDGADAVMLSAETATGAYPALAVETMRRVIESAEREMTLAQTGPSPARTLVASRYPTAALAHGAWHAARDVGAAAVVCWSQEGGTARYLSQTGLAIPVIAYSSDERQVRRMALLRGVTARKMDVPAENSVGAFVKAAEADLLRLGWVSAGDAVVVVAGVPLGVKRSTNSLVIHFVGTRDLGA
jgi:pyruvate kinase